MNQSKQRKHHFRLHEDKRFDLGIAISTPFSIAGLSTKQDFQFSAGAVKKPRLNDESLMSLR
jgi:hypothetical protein